MLTFAICDDDIAFVKLLSSHLNKLLIRLPDEIEYNILQFTSGEQALKHLRKSQFSAIFLDIDMPGMNGFELARAIRVSYPSMIIIFVSAYDSLVYDSFEFHPYRFLRKTRMNAEFEKTVQSILEDQMKTDATLDFSTLDGNVKLRLDDIVYIESEKNYYIIHCADKSVYRCRGTLSSVELMLDGHDFCRIHSSYLINLSFVEIVDSNRNIRLTDGRSFSVSYRRWNDFHNAYMNYSERRAKTV